MDDLDRLPNLSPIDEPEVPPMPRRVRRSTRMTMPIVMILAGIWLILVCAFVLFAIYGIAGKVHGDEPESPSRVVGWMFEIDGGSVTIPASLGVLLGIVLVVLGIVVARKRRREPEV